MGMSTNLPATGQLEKVGPSAWSGPREVNYNGRKISDPDVRSRLQELARTLNRTVHVTSGDRTPEDQERLLANGYRPAKNSMHLEGKAADVWVEGMTPAEVAPFAREVGFTGIGIYRDGHLHVDTRDHPATWFRE